MTQDIKIQHCNNVTDKILTLPNVISSVRLILVPIYFALLVTSNRIAALVIFSIAASTDFIDGQVARRTNSVSKLGKLLDPAVDTALMLSGVIGAVYLNELPLWVAIYIIAREVFLLFGAFILLKKFNIRINVIYPGKIATTLLFVSFAGMILGFPTVSGLDMTNIWWLYGFNSHITSIWIWTAYLGIIIQLGTTVYYCLKALQKIKDTLRGA